MNGTNMPDLPLKNKYLIINIVSKKVLKIYVTQKSILKVLERL
jgi:hypothetical protein